MINLFDVTPTDQSRGYLMQIFGTMHGVLAAADAPTTASILGSMFRTFNAVVLVVGALMIVYTTVVGVMMTAHEGEFMGKKWNNLWVPIRTVLGIGLLVPTSSGYSGLQIVMMWIIVQGIGAANTLWNTVLAYVDVVGTPYVAILPSQTATIGIEGLFAGLVCNETSKISAANPSKTSKGSYYCATPRGNFCQDPVVFNPNSSNSTLSLGPNGSCGSLSYCNQAKACEGESSTSLECLTCKAQGNALSMIVPLLTGIAKQFAQADYSYRQFAATSAALKASGGGGGSGSSWQWVNDYCSANNISPQNCCMGKAPCSSLPPPDENANTKQDASALASRDVLWKHWPGLGPAVNSSNFLQTVVNQYMGSLNQALSDYIQLQSQDPQASYRRLRDAEERGWVYAGAYYYTLAGMKENKLDNVLPEFKWTPANLTQGPMAAYRNNYAAAGALLEAAQDISTAEGTTSAAGASAAMSVVSKMMNSTVKTINSSFNASIVGKGENPLLKMHAVGETLLWVAQTIIFTIVTVLLPLLVRGFIGIWALGFGGTNPIGPAATSVILILLPAIYGFIGLLVVFGGTLAVYIPLIPFIIFTFGVIGWLISTVEAMVAGPLVALGILSPSGNHELLGKSEPALMLLFHVFLRPSLMIFGLIAAMLLASAVMTMINGAFFSIAFRQIGPTSPLSIILFIGAYVAIVFAALNKCFAAIYIIPTQVFAWIGGRGADYGEASALGEAKGGYQATSAQSKATLTGAAGGMVKEGTSFAKQTSDAKKEGSQGNVSAPESGDSKGRDDK